MKVNILLYHELAAKNNVATMWLGQDYSYVLDVEEFKRHMQAIHDSEQRVLGLVDFLSLRESKGKVDQKAVILTFDDGCSGFLTLARPILLKLAYPATIFVIPDKIGQPGFLNWDELKVLSGEGFSIQSHTLSHKALIDLSAEEIKKELAYSKSLIEERLGKKVRYLSIPMGMYNKRVEKLARETGYEAVCISFPGINFETMNSYNLRRNTIRRGMQLRDFSKLIAQNRFFLARQTAVAAFFNIARSISPRFLYKFMRSYLVKRRRDKVLN